MLSLPFNTPCCRLGNPIYHFTSHEAARVHSQGNAELEELVSAHLALPIEDVPEPLFVDTDASCQFGDRNAPVMASRL